MSSPTPLDAEREAREQISVRILGWDDRGWESDPAFTIDSALDAYRAAIIRRCLAAVEAEREGVKGADPDNIATWAHDEGITDACRALTTLLEET